MQLVALKMVQQAIHQQHHALGEIRNLLAAAVIVAFVQNAGAQPLDQLLRELLLAVKVGVKRALGHLCFLHDIIHRGFELPLADKQPIGGVQQIALTVFALGRRLFGHGVQLLSCTARFLSVWRPRFAPWPLSVYPARAACASAACRKGANFWFFLDKTDQQSPLLLHSYVLSSILFL